MKFILPKEMIPELLSGKIDWGGFFENRIKVKHDGKDCFIALCLSRKEESYFAEEGILCDIEYSLSDDSIYIGIYVSEYTFRQLLLGKMSLEEVLNKQRGYILEGPFRTDEEYKLIIN